MSLPQRLVFLGLAVAMAAVAVVPIVVGGSNEEAERRQNSSPSRPSERSTGQAKSPRAPAEPPVQAVRVADGRVVRGPKDIIVKTGDMVRLAFTAKDAEKLYIHGYDQHIKLRPKKTTRVNFRAEWSGIYAIDSRSTDAQVASLTVEP